jgi:hypothetical protein
MTSQSNNAPSANTDLTKRDLAAYGVARFRDQVFDAVLSLWRRRSAEGWTQKRVAEAIGRDPAWVSRNLRAPGNWTIQTVGELVQGLEGEVEVSTAALEDPVQYTSNYAAYNAYDGYRPDIRTGNSIGVIGTVSVKNPVVGDFAISNRSRAREAA